MKLSLEDKAAIYNQVLISTLWFYIIVWGGSYKILNKIKRDNQNYLWLGEEKFIQTRVSWNECCLKKKYGELGLIDPKMAKTNLLIKWIVKAMEPGDSNFQLILRYSISRYSPQKT